MKEDNNKKAKSANGFYWVLAFGLIAIGAAGFFAVAPSDLVKDDNEDKPSASYSEPDSSYNEKDEAPVENKVENQPYSSPQPIESEQAAEPIEKAPAFILPIAGGQIVKQYDDKALQYSATYEDMRIHKGTDILADAGSDILSSEEGTVKKVYSDAALGRVVEIDHYDGIVIKYCGFADDITVKEGQKVEKGFKLGTLSGVPSESADAPHLHIELTVSGKYKDPESTLKFK